MPEQFTHRDICQLRVRGQVIKDHFVSQVLSSNPLGDPAERDLLVYLPQVTNALRASATRWSLRLSGYSESDASLQNWLPFQPTLSDRLDLLMAQGALGTGLIVVMPDCFTAYGGRKSSAATCSSSCATPAIFPLFARSSSAPGDSRAGIRHSRRAFRRPRRI